MSTFGERLFEKYELRGHTMHQPVPAVDAAREFMINVGGPTLEEFIDLPATPLDYARSMLRFMDEMCSDEGIINISGEMSGQDFDPDEMRESSNILHSALLHGIEVYAGLRDADNVTDNIELLNISLGQLVADSRKIYEAARLIVEQAKNELGSDITIGDIWLNYDPPISQI